jgi:hypothetical protein
MEKGFKETKSNDKSYIRFGEFEEEPDAKIIQSLAERFVGGKFNM